MERDLGHKPALLSKMLSLAVPWKWRSDNPVIGAKVVSNGR